MRIKIVDFFDDYLFFTAYILAKNFWSLRLKAGLEECRLNCVRCRNHKVYLKSKKTRLPLKTFSPGGIKKKPNINKSRTLMITNILLRLQYNAFLTNRRCIYPCNNIPLNCDKNIHLGRRIWIWEFITSSLFKKMFYNCGCSFNLSTSK